MNLTPDNLRFDRSRQINVQPYSYLAPPKFYPPAKAIYDDVANGMVLMLSSAWIAAGMVRPARTDLTAGRTMQGGKAVGPQIHDDRYRESVDCFLSRFGSYDKLFSLQLDKYFMPLSQTFTVRAKKRLNVSSLVDGIDIIQQTRKDAKTIDCVLRISLREHQTNLHILDEISQKMVELSTFLQGLYENDTIFEISNETINRAFGVWDVFMTDYRFIPKVGMQTYTLEFSLMEVKGANDIVTEIPRTVAAAFEPIVVRTPTLNVPPPPRRVERATHIHTAEGAGIERGPDGLFAPVHGPDNPVNPAPAYPDILFPN